jgi:hypothetical protein
MNIMKCTQAGIALAMVMGLATTYCVQAAPIFTENFDGYSGNQNATQVNTGLPVAHTGSVTGWTRTGAGTMHAVKLSASPLNWAIMFYQDNVITLTTGIAANDSGVTYKVEFDYGTADYAGGQATRAGDGLLVEVVRAAGTTLASGTFTPGAWSNPGNVNLSAGLHGSFQYVGDGSGVVKLRIGPTPPLNSGFFEGEIDNLSVSLAYTPPSVTLTAPANGWQFLSGSSISSTATVANGSSPYTVNFYTNYNSGAYGLAGTTNASPYTINLGTLEDGTYTIYATVTDGVSSNATSTTNTFTVAATDTTAPTPNPMTFAGNPTALDTTSIIMMATTATDVLSPPVYYFFTNTVNGATSGWITSTVWTNTGLTLGTTYGYRVKARDSATPTPNETDWSATLTAPAFGGEYFVAPSGSDANSGMRLDSPFLTISNAVAKSDATIVTVSNGTYNIADQVVVGKALTVRSFGGGVYGGLANATNTVVNRGGGGSRVFNLSVAGVVLDGLTITGSGGSGYSGGGVYMPNGGTVQNCIVRNNKGPYGDYQFGGGVYMVGGTLSNCIVQANTTAWRGGAGAGIYADNSQIVNCQVICNTNSGFVNSSPAEGGGIYATASTLIRNCLIASNKTTDASTYGGGVVGGRIENCTIVGNSAYDTAGGVYGSVVTNSIVLNNTTVLGRGMNYGGPSTFAYSYSLPLPAGVGNITAASFVDAAGGNYRLMPCPAVDAGTNLAWMTGALDLDGNPRTNGVNNRVDMGAYERVPGVLVCGLAADVQSVLAPSNVVFTAFLDGTNKNITSYNWNFGDGQTASGSTLSSVTNTYSAAGLYTVTLTVTNDAGESAAGTNSNYVAVWGTYAYVAAASPSPSVPYHTWSNAAHAIADAVAAAPAGTTVIVTNGTYNISVEIPVSKALTIRSFGGGVYGGLANASNTVVSGPQNQGYGGPRIFNLTAAGTVLDGFTITKGYGSLDGNGVYMTNSTVINCIIKNNGKPEYYYCVSAKGAGVYMGGGTLSNCVVQGNTSGPRGGGGGIYANGGLIVDCQVLNNRNFDGWRGGGGIFANNSQIVNCQVIGNTSSATKNVGSDPTEGGGIYAQGSTLVRNCLIANNTQSVAGASGGLGGGVFGGRIENCTIVGNSASHATGTSGGGVYGSVVTNSIVLYNTTGSGSDTNYGGTCTFAYSCTAPLPAGTGNMMSDPLFVNAAAGNYRLASKPPASPCNDKGTNLEWMTGAVDLDGNLRIQHNIVDMGAYESVFIPAGTVILFF